MPVPPIPDTRDVTASRYAAVQRVLLRVLLLNLGVAAAKISFGAWSGTVSILSDGFHSLTDSASNIIAMIGVRAARQPADASHPYGHRKFETLSAAAIFVFLVVVLVQVAQTATRHLRDGALARADNTAFALMLGTLVINVLVVGYESRAGRRLRSELLIADSTHTRSDVYTSLAVIGALVGVRLGWPLLDPLGGLIVAGFIGRAGFAIAREASAILSDQVVMDEEDIRRVVMSVPEVLGCHQIRTRGSADHTFLDLHVWFLGEMPLAEAHRLSHVVKDRLMTELPSLHDVIIHMEPPGAH